MKTHARFLTAGLPVLVLGIWFLAADAGVAAVEDDALWKPILPEAWLSKLIADETRILQDELAKSKPEEKRIRCSGILIALAAQSTKGGNPQQLAAVRDTAMQVAHAAEKKNFGVAKKDADLLANFKELKADPKANPKPLNLRKQIDDLGDAMKCFSLPNKGGEGIEKEFLSLGGQRKALTQAQMSEKLVLMAYKSALVAEVAQAHADTAKNQKKDWLKWTDDMRRASLEVAEAAQAKKAKETKVALEKANSSCSACHGKFRD